MSQYRIQNTAPPTDTILFDQPAMRLHAAALWAAALPAFGLAFAPQPCRQANACLQRSIRVMKLRLHSATKPEEREAVIPKAADQSLPLSSSTSFVNDGPFSWLSLYLDKFGIREGKILRYAIPSELDESNRVPEATAAKLREDAAKKLQNIDTEERERRAQASKVMATATFLYAVWSALFADDGGLQGHLVRFGSVFPLFFAVGLRLSAKEGL